MTAQLPNKVYFRIGEVARILDVQPHVIRFWETEFKTIRPQKSRAGQRVYTRRDVEKLLVIKRLLREERFTIEGARKHLKERGLEAPSPADGTPAEPVAPSRVDALRAAMVAAREKLQSALEALDARPAEAPREE